MLAVESTQHESVGLFAGNRSIYFACGGALSAWRCIVRHPHRTAHGLYTFPPVIRATVWGVTLRAFVFRRLRVLRESGHPISPQSYVLLKHLWVSGVAVCSAMKFGSDAAPANLYQVRVFEQVHRETRAITLNLAMEK